MQVLLWLYIWIHVLVATITILKKNCVCAPGLVQKYLNRVSGPLLDLTDLKVEVTPVSFDELTEEYKSEFSSLIRNRFINARKVQARVDLIQNLLIVKTNE